MKQVLRKILSSAIVLAAFACGKDPFPGGGESNLEPVPPPDTLVTPRPDTSTTKKFFFGVNGHPLNQEAYATLSSGEQMSLLKSLGMNIYRVDFTVTSQGKIIPKQRFEKLRLAADSADITILPMLPDAKLDYNGTEEIAYQQGYDRGYGFAQENGNYFTYYNIGNELDNDCILPKKSGKVAEHYDSKKFKIIAAHLKGMDEGIKAVDPTAQTMVNASWMHYKYLQMLEQYGINYDIVAYHWYGEMETMASSTYNINDITQFLSTQFSKPIWLTEINIRNRTGEVSDQVQRDLLNTIIGKCKENPRVHAVIIYELFNEPVFNSIESYYGLYDWEQPYKKYKPKLWAAEQERKIAGL
ncbi:MULTISPECIES: glycosyl hydrolase [Olivibacter]|uniref:Glycosyl hydrolase n=1 Tax=Olivibacter jilunii TaxID=985016 RepID=A0ABW6BAW3_9SPHI|nr:glycosyl hydrolase [Pseudosphingobacterium sp.]